MENVTLVGGLEYVRLLYKAGFITQSQAIAAGCLRTHVYEFEQVPLIMPRSQYESIRAIFPKIDDKFVVK